MVRLIVAIALGLAVGVGGVITTQSLLNNAANGTPSSQSLYQYGSH